jgi:hypothetical protein
LNRQSIFDLFRQQGDVYLDLGTEHFGELTQRDVLSRVQKALQQYIKQQRPILFLTSASQNPPSFSKSILEWLKESSEPWEVYEVPQHGGVNRPDLRPLPLPCTHDWRGIDTGRMCAKCGLTEAQG